jgi:hypothetical protein
MNEWVESQRNYLLRCQLPSGTFRLGPERPQINPYFTNLALLALVKLGEWEPVKRHVIWYLQHVNTRGYVNDFRLEEGKEVDTGTADSEDSYHATLFSLLAEVVRHSENTEWIAPWKTELIAVFHAMALLQQRDGLTWAKHSWRVKYLMDNCEVWQGLEDAHYLFQALGAEEEALEAQRRANACRAGIASMYSSWRRTYAVYDRTYPTWRKWYPDVTSQAFPIVYGLSDPEIAEHLYFRIQTSFPYFDSFQTGDVYPWMLMGECARLMNDQHRVERMLQTAARLYIHGPRRPYWLIHEAGRFLQLVLMT